MTLQDKSNDNLRMKANESDPEAKFELGKFYEQRIGTEKNLKESRNGSLSRRRTGIKKIDQKGVR